MTLSTKNNFSKNPDYKKLFKRPPLLVSKEFSLWLGANGLGCARFGVIVAKKNVKIAVVRNYSKRFAREQFKNYRSLFKNKDVVLVIKKPRTTSNLTTWKNKLAGVYYWLSHFGC